MLKPCTFLNIVHYSVHNSAQCAMFAKNVTICFLFVTEKNGSNNGIKNKL